MKKHFLSLLLCCSSFFCFGQNKDSLLAGISSLAQANDYIKSNPAAKLFTLESGADTSALVQPLYHQQPGYSFTIGNARFKIIELDSALSFRVNYIYINGEQYSKKQADSLRKLIIDRYRKGEEFYVLSEEYGMDGNMSGDTGWFQERTMVNQFETAVRQHKKGDIFTVDTPDRNWYHVVLKTFDDSQIKKLTILRIESANQH
jgi:PPIC-type PPIASE domain